MKSLSLNQPHAIVMVGIPGSGKSFFAEKFAETFNAPYVNYDTFRPFISDSKQLSKVLAHQMRELLKTNYSIVVEGVAQTRAERTELAKYLKQHGYETVFIWVQTDPRTALTRSLKQAKHSKEEHERLTERFSPPHETEKPVVISGKHTYATQVRSVLKRLSGPRAEISTHSTPPVRSLRDVRRTR
jgi:predicted kinase